MKKGTLTLYIPGREELYWMAAVVVTGLCYMVLRERGMGRNGVYIAAGVAVVLILLKFTLLRHWHIRTVDWTLDEDRLVLGGEEIPRSSLTHVSCRQGRGGPHSWILTLVSGRRQVRCYSLMKGKDAPASARAMQELALALDPNSVEEAE